MTLYIGQNIYFTITDLKTGELKDKPAIIRGFPTSKHTTIEVDAPTQRHPSRTLKFTILNTQIRELHDTRSQTA